MFVLGLLLVPGAPSSADFMSSYTVTINDGVPDIDHLILFEESDSSSSATWPFWVAGDGETSILDHPFPSAVKPLRSLWMGLITLSEVVEPAHLVLFMDSATAAAVEGINFEDAFPNTDHAALMQAIFDVTTADGDWDLIDSAFLVINEFLYGDARNVLGLGHSAYFDTEGPFSVVQFSTGTIIGSGFGSITGGVIPEPSSLALSAMGAAVCLLATIRQRQSRRGR